MRKKKDETLLYARGEPKIIMCPETIKLMSLISIIYSIKGSYEHLSADLKNLGASQKDRKRLRAIVKNLVEILIGKKLDSIRGLHSVQKTRLNTFIGYRFPLLSGFLDTDD